MVEITETTSRIIENELIAKHGLIVVPKAGALATFVGMAFDIGRFIRPNLPTGQAFNGNFPLRFRFSRSKDCPAA